MDDLVDAPYPTFSHIVKSAPLWHHNATMTLLSHADIVSAAERFREPFAAIYFLLGRRVGGLRVLYVGQSVQVWARLHAHRKDQSKVFSHYAILKCRREELNDLEAAYIRELKPAYNAAMPPGHATVVRRTSATKFTTRFDYQAQLQIIEMDDAP